MLKQFDKKRRQPSGQKAFSLMTKPIGPICNMQCSYCYYLEKLNLYQDKKGVPANFRMDDDVLQAYVQNFILSQPSKLPVIEFTWQGGEPTLLGLEFFEKAVEYQKEFSNGRNIANALQTNGTRIDEKWAKFFAKHDFLIGISIDGPKEIHDANRVTKGNKGTWDRVTKSIKILKKYGVRYNLMVVVNSLNAQQPRKVYEFLRRIGDGWIQFIPIQERITQDENAVLKLVTNEYEGEAQVTKESVSPEAWGKFLIEIFNIWVQRDVGRVYVKQFDNALEAFAGQMPSTCVHSKHCGQGLVMEHNGDVFACDHYVYPEFKIGNIKENSLEEMACSTFQENFGEKKYTSLPQQCLRCKYLPACFGECPKHRITTNEEGEKIAYLCEGYYEFFKHTEPYMKTMAQLLKAQRPPAEIMQMMSSFEWKGI